MTSSIRRCSGCGKRNRVPAAGAGKKALCGACGLELPRGPLILTDRTFDEEIAKGPVLVDFWAEWCGPCHMLAPTIEALAAEHDSFVTAKLNVDENPQVAGRYRVSSIPTLIVFRSGEEIARMTGVRSRMEIEQSVRTALSTN